MAPTDRTVSGGGLKWHLGPAWSCSGRAGLLEVTRPVAPRDITLRYKETRRQKQQSGGDDKGSAKGSVDGTLPGPDVPPGPVEAEREGAPALD